MSIGGSLKNKVENKAWNKADVTELEEYMNLMCYSTYEDVTIELRSTDSDNLYFMNGFIKTASIKQDVSECLSVGDELDFSADIYVNTEYCPENGADVIPVEYTVYSGTDIVVYDKVDVTIKNTDYVPTPEFESVSLDELLVILYEKIDEYHPKFLKSKEPVISVFTSAILNESITEMKGLYESFDNLKVAIDVNNMVCKANIGGLVLTASDAYLTKLFESIEEEAKSIAGYTNSALEKLIESDDFKDYVEWYQTEYGYINGYYKEIGVHCPTDIVVKDEDSKIVLTISDNVIQLNDELIYAFVYENEKIFYLPTNIDYTIEILATDDGVMDYEVSTITPGGAERVVAYDDVKLEKDEVFTSLVTSEVYQSVDTYNLVSNSGEIVETDCDTLPPVSSDVTDVVIAEELFSDFSKDSINALADAMFSMKSSVSLSEYKIALNDSVALFSAVSKYYPVEYSLMANGDFSYRIVYNKANNYITEIRFDYGEAADLSRYQEKVAAVKTEIDALVDVIKGMSDFEKALYIHDYIVLNCQYDTELLKVLETDGKLSGELVSERYSEYSVLVNGTGICGSYALAYRAILNASGVECVYVSSTEMNHAWNMVKIDGEWYHVDCCWDDPVPDSEGIARRTHFLRTDKEMMDLSHYSWSPGQYKATSEKYSDMPRNYDYVQKYDYTNDDWYYLLGNTIYKADKYGNNKTTFAKNIKADSIDCNNGRVFYSDDLFVYEYSDTEETWEPVYYVSKYDVGYDPKVAYIVNFFVDENNISYYKYTKEDYYNSEDDYGIISTVTYVKDELKREVFESITGIEIDYTELEMAVFDYEYIYSTIITDYDVWDLDVEYSSSDENIVSVDEYGTIIALNAGEAVITASFMEYSATCVVKVIGGDSSAGSCGTNIKWIYDAETGKLSLNGSGAMTNYTSGKTPWNSFVAEIKSVEISDGITSIGNFAFYNGKNITSVTIPETVTSIGRYSFNNCGKVEKLDIPSKVTSIGDSAFAFCYALSDVEIPSGVNKLGSSVFEYCESLSKIELPTAINYIDTYMFCGCESLEEVTFGSNIEHIRDYAFMYAVR